MVLDGEGKDPPILATVFSRTRMRFALNKTDCLHLTAFHGVYPEFQSEVMRKALLAYLNSNLGKDIQVIKRREYGGGLRASNHAFRRKRFYFMSMTLLEPIDSVLR